jgi:hypothetical protein
MGNKSKYNLEERTSWVNKWRSSGMNKGMFCKEHGLNFNTFKHWNQILNRPDLPTNTLTPSAKSTNSSSSKESFVSVKLENNLFEPSGGTPFMELTLSNGGTLRFYQAVSVEYIRELLK